MPHPDPDVLLAGGDLHVTTGRMRPAVRAAHGALLASAARGGGVACTAWGTSSGGGPWHAVGRSLRFGLRLIGAFVVEGGTGTFPQHLDLGARVACSDPQVTARGVRPPVGPTQRPLSATTTNVLTRARAQGQALHVLHAHLELRAFHLFAGTT